MRFYIVFRSLRIGEQVSVLMSHLAISFDLFALLKYKWFRYALAAIGILLLGYLHFRLKMWLVHDDPNPRLFTSPKSPELHRMRPYLYRDMCVLTCLGSMVFALSYPTKSTLILCGLLIVGAYFDLIGPGRLMNKPPRAKLHRPWSTRLCLLLAGHAALNLLVNPLAISFTSLTVLHALGIPLTPTPFHAWKFWCASLIAVHTGYFPVTRGIFATGKRLLVGSTRIVVFRRFEATMAQEQRSKTLPVIGAFGYLILYSDRYLFGTQQTRQWETEDLVGGWFFHMKEGNPKWDKEIQLELRKADFVVFDWVCMPTAAMDMECGWAVEMFASQRLLWLVPASNIVPVTEYLKEKARSDEPFVVISRDDKYWSLAKSVRRAIAQNERSTSRTLEGSTLVGSPGNGRTG